MRMCGADALVRDLSNESGPLAGLRRDQGSFQGFEFALLPQRGWVFCR